MCGIAGIWLRDGQQVDENALTNMLDSIKHRGPDGQDIWRDGAIGIGHTRLSIIDVSELSLQPMVDDDSKFIISYNGEVHNYKELRAELITLGYLFRTSGDTEVVLNAFKCWGTLAFSKFNGMWALAIWDLANKKLTLCRDRFGIKPLYYSILGNRIVFSSEAKAILAAFPEEKQANFEEIHSYLMGGSPDVGEQTFFANIKTVSPATYMTFAENGGVDKQKYWEIGSDVNTLAIEENVDLFKELLRDATRLRLRSDVPLGAALSGGLDSSAIVRLAANEDVHPDCYSLRYLGQPYDESGYASIVADKAKCEIHWVEPDAKNTIDLIQEIVWHHDAPTAIRGRLPHWAVMRQASQDVRVMLEGTGSDELLAGYSFFVTPYLLDSLHEIKQKKQWNRLKKLVQEINQLNAIGGYKNNYFITTLLNSTKKLLPTYPWKQCATREFRNQFGEVSLLKKRGAKLSNDIHKPFLNRLDNALWHDFSYAGLPESLHGCDAASMAFSVESRAPFLDHRLVEFCFALPSEQKISNGWTKRILREALIDDLPKKIIRRKVKLGFPAPYGQWLSSESNYKMLSEILLSTKCLQRGILDKNKLHTLFASKYIGQKYVRRYVEVGWRMLSMEIWFRNFIDVN